MVYTHAALTMTPHSVLQTRVCFQDRTITSSTSDKEVNPDLHASTWSAMEEGEVQGGGGDRQRRERLAL